MIAVAGTQALLRGERVGPELNADAGWRLGQEQLQGQGS
jgi:hypothetical protein